MAMRRRSAVRLFGLLLGAAFLMTDPARGQELEPRWFSPSPIGTKFLLGSMGRSEGGILFDPALDIDNVQADLWIATVGAGYTFALAGRQAKVLAVVPIAWGALAANVHDQPQSADMNGFVDPRFKISMGLLGAPALSLTEFGRTPRRTAVGVAVTITPPWGQYDARQFVNVGYNRWAFKTEIGVSHPIGRWTIDGSAGVWLFTANDSYFPGRAIKTQDPVLALQAHSSYSLPRRSWLAIDATWFTGGETRVDRVRHPDLQRNTRVGATLSIPLAGQQSIKFAYSTGATTRRGSDFDTLNVTWQLVKF